MDPVPFPIYINGRFLAQPLAGVQRYAMEMSRALRELYTDRVTVLAPRNAKPAGLGEVTVGRMTGQIWEQVELSWHARKGILVNLGNTASMVSVAQAVVLHDAGVFSTPEAYSLKFRVWYKTMHNVLAHNGTRLISVSMFSRADIAKHLHIPAARISVVGEGADHMHRMAPEPEILMEHGLIANKYVLVVGTLAAHKNVAALEKLSDRLAARGLVLVVTGAFGAAAFHAGNRSRWPDTARYLGRVSDGALRTLYENAACFVFPSTYEGFGLPAVEAMACGCAVVAADIPALRECCGDAATYCDPSSPENIASVVMGLLDDPARLAQARRMAKRQVENLTWANAAHDLMSIIKAGFNGRMSAVKVDRS